MPDNKRRTRLTEVYHTRTIQIIIFSIIMAIDRTVNSVKDINCLNHFTTQFWKIPRNGANKE